MLKKIGFFYQGDKLVKVYRDANDWCLIDSDGRERWYTVHTTRTAKESLSMAMERFTGCSVGIGELELGLW